MALCHCLILVRNSKIMFFVQATPHTVCSSTFWKSPSSQSKTQIQKHDARKRKSPWTLREALVTPQLTFFPPSSFVSCWWINRLNNDCTDAPGSIHFQSMLLLPKLLWKHPTGPGEPGKLLSGAHRQHRSIQNRGKQIMGREKMACGFLTRPWNHKFSVIPLLLETHGVSVFLLILLENL